MRGDWKRWALTLALGLLGLLLWLGRDPLAATGQPRGRLGDECERRRRGVSDVGRGVGARVRTRRRPLAGRIWHDVCCP